MPFYKAFVLFCENSVFNSAFCVIQVELKKGTLTYNIEHDSSNIYS